MDFKKFRNQNTVGENLAC